MNDKWMYDKFPVSFLNLSIKRLFSFNTNLITLLYHFKEGNKVCFIPLNSTYTKVKKGNRKFVVHYYKLKHLTIHNSILLPFIAFPEKGKCHKRKTIKSGWRNSTFERTKTKVKSSEYKIKSKECKHTSSGCKVKSRECKLKSRKCKVTSSGFKLKSEECKLTFSVCVLTFSVCVLTFSVCVLTFSVCVLTFSVCVLTFFACVLTFFACVLTFFACVLTSSACNLRFSTFILRKRTSRPLINGRRGRPIAL